MNIYPEDLGPGWQEMLLRRRLPAGSGLSDHPAPVKRIGLLGRWWTQGVTRSPQAQRTVLAALRDGGSAGLSVGFGIIIEAATTGIAALLTAHGHVPGAAALEAGGTALTGLYLAMPRMAVRRAVGTPVTQAEIEELRASVGGLASEYLALAAEAAGRQAGPETESEMRAALCMLGTAMQQIPDGLIDPDPQTLRSEAVRAAEAASGETDPVVAASHRRRAETLVHAAETAAHSQRLARRTAALREEAAAQIRTLRLSLTGLRTDTGEADALALLADAIQGITAEADILAAARAEMDAALPLRPELKPEKLGPETVKEDTLHITRKNF